jgi:peptide chain release factor 3
LSADTTTIAAEASRRRAFAIISHPDAGKTTLTEKLLLYGGAVQLAGSVTARKTQRASTSDWMELERKRGISVSSTVLQFDYRGHCLNLLDTPGHKDFSEDTYRVLMAVDAAVMVIDAGKGIESQTRKLFEVCRLRGIPIFTFMNKLDRPSLDPLELLDEIERVLGIRAYPMTWPLGSGEDFRGVYDRRVREVHFFQRVPGGAYRAPLTVVDPSDPAVREQMDPASYERVLEEIHVLDGAGEEFSPDSVRSGDQTPVFFGSAVNNFGVQLLLDGFLELSPPPGARMSADGPVEPTRPAFSGFVFKIQSNMDPRHRDQIAFVRVCSGRFARDMKAIHARTGNVVRLSSSHKIFARERETVDEAFPGDVVGLVGHSEFAIGDTLTEDPAIVYEAIPRFAPEHFAYLHCAKTTHAKRFRAGLEHLLQEGVVQAFRFPAAPLPVLGAVGPLQFEVLQYRLEAEYGAESRLESAPWTIVRWVASDVAEEAVAGVGLPTGCRLARDDAGHRVILFGERWAHEMFSERHPEIALTSQPLPAARVRSARVRATG